MGNGRKICMPPMTGHSTALQPYAPPSTPNAPHAVSHTTSVYHTATSARYVLLAHIGTLCAMCPVAMLARSNAMACHISYMI